MIEQDQESTVDLRHLSGASLLTLAGCGGEDGGGGQPAPASTPSANEPRHSDAEASRFLAQATLGATRAEIDSVAERGIESWLDRQFSMARPFSYYDWLISQGFAEEEHMFSLRVWERPLWKGLLSASDTLRQRITLALLDILVAGIPPLNPFWRSLSLANYLDVLADGCFGNFRDLLRAVTFTPAMGSFLTYVDSRKADGRGRRPDENYARELMQLFTIGPYRLAQDGTRMADASGNAVPTYSQIEIAELARIFTGLELAGPRENPQTVRLQLRVNSEYNDSGSIAFLGNQISGGGEAAIDAAIDILFNHPNVGPFISRRLIQSLITSNPSADFVRRVAGVFANNGSGKRGDLKAVVRAILTDAEARSPLSTQGGRLRDPIQRFCNLARCLNIRDQADVWHMPTLLDDLAKWPGWSPTVFNFHAPDFSPSRTEISRRGMLAPEFQIVSEQTSVQYLNLIHRVLDGRLSSFGLAPDFSHFRELAETPSRLVDELALILTADQLSSGTRAVIIDALASISAAQSQIQDRRTDLAVLLIMASPEYLVVE